MANNNLYSRFIRMQSNSGIGVADTADLVDTNSGLSQISAVKDVTNTGAGKIAFGTGTLVSGTVVVATGLTACTAFFATLQGTGASSSGVTETSEIVVSSITTGAVTVTGSYNAATGVRIASASGTTVFYWMAYGT
jgi:hypothetical protein